MDLDGDGVELISLDDSTTQFDIDADGFAEITGWVKPDDGLLAIDLNSDGNINNRDELFGVDASTDGFMVLTGYDSNGDNAITSADAQFGALRVWRDLDGNGSVSAGELKTLAATGVSSISLNDASSSQVIEGHDVLRASTFVINGQTRAALDVMFNVSQTNSSYILDESFVYDTDVFALPQLRGFGDVPDLWVAMTQDGQLLQMVQALTDANYASFNYAAFKNSVQDVMFRWTGVDAVGPKDRGEDIDARILEGAEKWLGIVYTGFFDTIYPYNNQAKLISNEWSQLVDAVATRLLVQIPTEPLFEAMSLATARFNALVDSGANVDSFTDAQWNQEFGGFFNTANTAINAHPLKFLTGDVEYDFISNTLAGSFGDFIAALAAKEPASNKLAYWKNYLPVINAVADSQGLEDAEYVAALSGTYLDTLSSEFVSGLRTGTNLEGTAASEKLTGTPGNDFLVGHDLDGTSSSGDTFEGGRGDDRLEGRGGNDVFVYNAGDGNDTINEYDGSADKISFGAGIVAGDLSFRYTEHDDLFLDYDDRNDDLQILVKQGGSILLEDFYALSGEEVESIAFADGATMTRQQIEGRRPCGQHDHRARYRSAIPARVRRRPSPPRGPRYDHPGRRRQYPHL